MSVTTTSRSAWHVIEVNALVYRRIWRANLFSTFAQPLLYLLAMGIGVGTLVDRTAGSTDRLGGVPYLAFIAPGLLAVNAMLLGTNESMWPVLAGFRWSRGFHAMAATPMEIRGIVAGQLGWTVLRMLGAGSGVALVFLLFADTRSAGLPLAVVFAACCGLAFAAPITAFAASRDQENGNSFSTVQRFVITPLFLFGGAFFPIEQLPAAFRPIAKVTPLWHGVELCRAATLHRLQAGAVIGHLAVLAVWTLAGTVAALAIFRRNLTR